MKRVKPNIYSIKASPKNRHFSSFICLTSNFRKILRAVITILPTTNYQQFEV